MSLSDTVALLAGILIPLLVAAWIARRRFRARVRYRIEALSHRALLTFQQMYEVVRDGSGVGFKPKEHPASRSEELQDALHSAIADFSAAISDDAAEIDRRLARIRGGTEAFEDPFSAWHTMLFTLYEGTRYEFGPGTILQLQGIVHLILLFLGLTRGREGARKSVAFLKQVHADSIDVPVGPAARVMLFAEALLPARVLAEVKR